MSNQQKQFQEVANQYAKLAYRQYIFDLFATAKIDREIRLVCVDETYTIVLRDGTQMPAEDYLKENQ